MKNVHIRSFSGPRFAAFGLDKDRYRVSPRIQSKYREVWTRKTPRRHAYGGDYNSVRLIKTYFSNRNQIIKLDSVFSLWLQTIILVSQTSILGLLPLNIFLNDLLLTNLRSITCNLLQHFIVAKKLLKML